MIIWCTIDLFLHFVGRRQGVPRKVAAGLLVFFFIMVAIVGIITSVALRGQFNEERDGYRNLITYMLSHEYFRAASAGDGLGWVVSILA